MARSSEQSERVELLGCTIDRLDMKQTLARCVELIERGEYTQHMSVNAAKLVHFQRDEKLREIIRECGLVNADGQSIVWASRLVGDPLPERVAGVDLMNELMALSEQRGWGIFVLGAKAEVLDEAVRRLRLRHPGLRIVGSHHGYFSASDSHGVAEIVRQAKPEILFVAMSSPMKEYWLGAHGRHLGVPLVMGVGGSIDVTAGVTRRAPRLMQVLGLEWLYRVFQEPRRLASRYYETNWQFIRLVAQEALERRRERTSPSRPPTDRRGLEPSDRRRSPRGAGLSRRAIDQLASSTKHSDVNRSESARID